MYAGSCRLYYEGWVGAAGGEESAHTARLKQKEFETPGQNFPKCALHLTDIVRKNLYQNCQGISLLGISTT